MKYLIACLFIFLLLEVKADIGSEDVLEFEYDGYLYYTKIHTNGLLKKNDLCYYSWSGDYRGELLDYFKNSVTNRDSIVAYSEMIEIEISKMDERYINEESLYFFRNEKKIPIDDLEMFKLVKAYNGNTFGYALSPNTSKVNFDWVNDYEIEHLFHIGDYDMCSYDYYSIKDNFRKDDIENMKNVFSKLCFAEECNQSNKIREELLSRNVFIISFCSC